MACTTSLMRVIKLAQWGVNQVTLLWFRYLSFFHGNTFHSLIELD